MARAALVTPPLLILLIFAVFGIFANVIAPGDPGDTDVLNKLARPVFDGGTGDNPLGTDHIGRDIWIRLVHGAQVSLIVAGIVVPGAALFGSIVGLIAGWRGGKVGQALMRYVDVQLALPAVPLRRVARRRRRRFVVECDCHSAGLDLDRLCPARPRRGPLTQGEGVRRRLVGCRRQQLVDHAQAAGAQRGSTRLSWS